jgi:hypothetical protein
MTISTTSDFTVTRNDLITQALSAIGVSEPQNNDMALGVKVLNYLVRNLDARGEWLWGISNTESTLTTVASQQAYVTGVGASNINANILKITYVSYLDGNDYLPLTIYDKYSSFLTSLKDDSPGQPEACHLERHNLRSGNRLLIYPTPNSAYTIKYAFRRPLFDFTLPTDNPDFPSEWFLPLQKMLSSELSGHYNKSLPERQWLLAESEKAFQEMLAFNADKPSYVPLRTEYF